MKKSNTIDATLEVPEFFNEDSENNEKQNACSTDSYYKCTVKVEDGHFVISPSYSNNPVDIDSDDNAIYAWLNKRVEHKNRTYQVKCELIESPANIAVIFKGPTIFFRDRWPTCLGWDCGSKHRHKVVDSFISKNGFSTEIEIPTWISINRNLKVRYLDRKLEFKSKINTLIYDDKTTKVIACTGGVINELYAFVDVPGISNKRFRLLITQLKNDESSEPSENESSTE